MAKRRRSTPRPPSRSSPKLVPLGTGAVWRVHSASFRPTQFNSSDTGDARFSPIRRPDGITIPVLYGASTLAGAMMETVLHDVPTPPDGYILDIESLREQNLVVSRIRPKRRLPTVDLSTKGLKRLGLQRTDLIDTPVTLIRGRASGQNGSAVQPQPKGLFGLHGKTTARERSPYSGTDFPNQHSRSKSNANRCARTIGSTH
jgi:hypothetical protein